MRKTVVLSGLAALIAACLALWPSPSCSASKGRAAALLPPGKGAAPSTARVRQPGLATSPGGKVAKTKRGSKRFRAELYVESLDFKMHGRRD